MSPLTPHEEEDLSTVATPLPVRPAIELPRSNRPLSQFGRELGETLVGVGAEIFTRFRKVFILNSQKDALEEIHAQTFRTWIETHVCCYVRKVADDMVKKLQQTLSRELAVGVIAAHQFTDCLNECIQVNTVQLPVIRASGSLELLPCGYDKETKTFTSTGPSFVQIKQDMSLEEAKVFLADLFAEFPWKADGGRSLSVELACLLTGFCAGMLPRGTQRPCFLFTANAEGSGKTLLARIVRITITGKDEVKTLSGDEDEIRKWLMAEVKEGRPIVILDNLKGHLNSSSLEGFLTSANWSDRILGETRTVSAEVVMTVLITGNNLTVSPDIRRRALWVELFLEELKAETRQLKKPIESPDIFLLRPKILSALWALVREWDVAGRPAPKQHHMTFISWSKLIGGILENAGYESPTKAPDLSKGGDTVTRDFVELAKLIASLPTMKCNFKRVIEFCVEEELFDFMLSECEERKIPGDSRDRTFIYVPSRAKSTFGKFLANQDGRIVGEHLRFTVTGKGHSREYEVVYDPTLTSSKPIPEVPDDLPF